MPTVIYIAFSCSQQMKSVGQINTGFSSSPKLKSQLPSQFSSLIEQLRSAGSRSKHSLWGQIEETEQVEEMEEIGGGGRGVVEKYRVSERNSQLTWQNKSILIVAV